MEGRGRSGAKRLVSPATHGPVPPRRGTPRAETGPAPSRPGFEACGGCPWWPGTRRVPVDVGSPPRPPRGPPWSRARDCRRRGPAFHSFHGGSDLVDPGFSPGGWCLSLWLTGAAPCAPGSGPCSFPPPRPPPRKVLMSSLPPPPPAPR